MTVLDRCNVLICPSHSEGMPNVILEAMARGLFILATDVGATDVLVKDGENGKLILSGDKNELFNAIKEIVELSPNELAAKGLIGRSYAQQKFAWSTIAAQLREEISKRLRNH
jgi:glycosyltransferase involved in cell wall biosynthesis